MKELSMHILDIAGNSIRAKANNITIEIEEDIINDRMTITIQDDGIGIDKDFLSVIKDPFSTTRKLRNVGLGIPLLDTTCSICGGDLDIQSKLGEGTKVIGKMIRSHIDRPPMGDISSSIVGLITSHPELNIKYHHKVNQKEFSISTEELKQILGEEVSLSNVQVYKWLMDYVKDNIKELYNIN